MNCANFFQNSSIEGCQWMNASEGTIQNSQLKSRKFSEETFEPSSVIVKPSAFSFALILLINLKPIIS